MEYSRAEGKLIHEKKPLKVLKCEIFYFLGSHLKPFWVNDYGAEI